jgi:hypothetical protein
MWHLSTDQGFRRPILLGLWQPGPRDRQSVEARFVENIKKHGPNWGQPVWTRQPTAVVSTWGPHDYAVEVPYHSGRRRYLIVAVARNTDACRTIGIEVFMFGPEDDPVSRDSMIRVSTGQDGIHSGPIWQDYQTATSEINRALRDALE